MIIIWCRPGSGKSTYSSMTIKFSVNHRLVRPTSFNLTLSTQRLIDSMPIGAAIIFPLLMLSLLLNTVRVASLRTLRSKAPYASTQIIGRVLYMSTSSAEIDSLTKAISEKGEQIRKLKSEKPPTLKESLAPLVSELLALKNSYKQITGEDFGVPKTDKPPAASEASKRVEVSMEELVNLCKSRGFVFQSSEIYSSMPGFFDFGPLGVELKNNIKKLWWKEMVQRREDIVGIDCSIIASPLVWQASGHVAGFSDPMVDCKASKLRFRADQVFWSKVETVSGEEVGYVTVLESNDMQGEATKAAMSLSNKLGVIFKWHQLIPFRNIKHLS